MSTSSETEPLDGIGLVADSFRSAMVKSLGEPPPVPNAVLNLLTEHFGADPRQLDTVTDQYQFYLSLNRQAAFNAFLAEEGRTHRIFGVNAHGTPLSMLMIDASLAVAPLVLAPARYTMMPSGSDSTMPVLFSGMILFKDADGPGAIWLRGDTFDVMHADGKVATDIVAWLRERSGELSPFRGQVVEITSYPEYIRFIKRPEHTEADQVVLPKGLLEEIEEHTIEVAKARRTLTATGRHLKRGILLHGRPGTGKTHTIRYLVSQMPDATIVVMSGKRMIYGGLEVIREVVDSITPGVVILDDVDFIAEDRSMPGQTANRDALFALLDLLDGIDDDADLLFVLTTNRPNQLEPAVAARPGRIDQAIEVPLPDADCRRRLLELYTRGVDFKATEADIETFVGRTEGVTASFVREAVRRAVSAYVLRDGVDKKGKVVVTGADLDAVLDELLDPERPLTTVLLGAEPEYAQATLAQIIAPAE